MVKMGNRIPAPLLPYIDRLNPGDLALVTNVLGASADWIVLRYLASICRDTKTQTQFRGERFAERCLKNELKTNDAIVLVSWMHDWEYWRSEARRSVGIDLAKAQQTDQFIFIDGLTTLFTCSVTSSPSTSHHGTLNGLGQSSNSGNHTRESSSSHSTSSPRPSLKSQSREDCTLSSLSTIQAIYRKISEALDRLTKPFNEQVNRQILLILDSPNVLLETYQTQRITVPHVDQQTLQIDALQDLFLHIRLKYQHVLSSVVVVPVDDPLLASAQNLVSVQHRIYRGGRNDDLYTAASETPLDRRTAAFAMALAHQSLYVIQCRKLDTGWAEDVSGVVRVTRGGAVYNDDGAQAALKDQDHEAAVAQSHEAEASSKDSANLRDGEWLYHVSGDGSVTVWSRGSGK